MTGSGTEVRESFRRMKWWHWVLTVLMAVGVFFGIQWILKSSDDDTHPLSAVAYQGQVGVPGQVLLPPMQRQPVPGWRVDLRQLFPDVVRPTIEHVGDNGNRAFFSVSYNVRATGQPKSWLLGIDATTGATLFAPVEIDEARRGQLSAERSAAGAVPQRGRRARCRDRVGDRHRRGHRDIACREQSADHGHRSGRGGGAQRR
ncbi:hypothetical protein [Mycolicibacterium mageritense]|uniref:hypothetical protein n=1 Tax=Mycolicibacterium mageritense TaxID=53462 RepID=UPI001E4C164D|nr:hypothetical protein [Mycolicibacterium mageritense]MCC9180127.1 hypothetical protein [Mycolicibacterium mageritense]